MGGAWFSGRSGRGRVLLVALAALCAVALIVLVLDLEVAPAPKGTLTSAVVEYSGEGRSADGNLWFGWSEANYTGAQNGYPYAYSPGGTFNFSISVTNGDVANHTFYAVSVASPFRLAGTLPRMPYTVGGMEDFLLVVVVGAPSSVGTYGLEITLEVGG